MDEVVAVYFSKGRGYTGEDALDIMCHGGPQVIESVLAATVAAGARLAGPGEFSYRAFINNRIDLIQAENVLQLIHSSSPKAANRALRQLRGALSGRVQKIETDIIYILANLEASIDFTTEDIQPVDFFRMKGLVDTAILEIQELLKGFSASQTVNQGFRIAIVGKPNAGKSSLLNVLLGRRRSIVSPKPGTTRDTIEADILIDGYLLRFVDTAGLRTTDEDSERQGVELTFEEIETADHILYVVDSKSGLQNEDVDQILKFGPSAVTVCFNKSDLVDIEIETYLNKFGLQKYVGLKCSAVTDGGRESLMLFISKSIVKNSPSGQEFDVSTVRQNELLAKALESLVRASEALAVNLSPEFISLELRESHRRISELLGKDVSDEVMDRVFKEFCIGK